MAKKLAPGDVINMPDTPSTKEDDPWALPEFVDTTTPWKELTTCGRMKRVLIDYIGKVVLLILMLYLFIVSLDFLGSAFKLLGGKTAGKIFRQNELISNPICGLMIGVLVTVLVQSSSTSTSIIITMTAQGFLDVSQAIYVIMGANIGTSVTNTIVSLGQVGDRTEFRRAFAGATIHDMFNWLSVLIVLPLEVMTGMLQKMTKIIVESFHIEVNKNANQDILKVVTKPFSSLFVKLDKSVIKAIALDVNGTLADTSILKRYCKKAMTSYVNGTNETITTKPVLCHSVYSYFPENISDEVIGTTLLLLALFILCMCLVFIVKLLHSLLKGAIARIIHNVVNADFPGPLRHLTGYVAIILGAVLTFVVQSSSIFTSTLTPLVGVGIVSLDRMYPLTLGANIGTTTTGILASLANSGQELINGLQLALCHLFFNIIGIIIWYPIPFLRKVPINLAKGLGTTTGKYRWFAIFYIIVMFFCMPAVVLGLSVISWYALLGVGLPILLVSIIVVIINTLQSKKPLWLPAKLRDWEWLPLWMHSLRPLDKIIQTVFSCKCCKSIVKKPESNTPVSEADNPKSNLNGIDNDGMVINVSKL